jgi:hypothetical protein
VVVVSPDEGLPVWDHVAERRLYEFEAYVEARLAAEPTGEWVPIAAATEQAARDALAEIAAEQELVESRWPWAELFAAQAADIGEVHYPW